MTVQFCPEILARSDKSFMINDLFMVEAAGVGLYVRIENKEVIEK